MLPSSPGILSLFQEMKVHLDASKQSLHFLEHCWLPTMWSWIKFDTPSGQLPDLFIIIFLCHSVSV